jgi:hypothetical protein
MIMVPASLVFADIIQSPGTRWQATVQQKDLPASISETGRGLHYVQDHTAIDLYDIFPLRASIFQISEARFLILNNELAEGEQFSIDLVSLDLDGNIQSVLSHQVITSDNINTGVWHTVDLSVIELLSSQNFLAFHVYADSFSGNHKIAYEVLVHNMITEFYSYFPLIFR